MEPLMPSEIARLVYGYLKHENNEMAAECFLKTSPHLTECYQIFKANKNFNIKVNGLNLHNIFDIFGTMCSMINERIPEICESKTLIEKLEYLLNVNHISTKNDIGVGTEIYTVDKCIGDMLNTEDKSTNTSIDESKKSTTERIEIPLFTNMINSNISETKEIELITNDMNIIENNLITPRLSSTSQLLNHRVNTLNFSSNDNKDSPKFKINDQTCSTPIKKLEETKQIVEPILQCSPKNIQYFDQPECQQIPEATSLDSMPGLSKEDKFKDNSIVVDTGELIDTLLNDQNLLEKIADTINKSISDQTEINIEQDSKILDTPTLEKALDSTQSDPQIKNVLDEFLVFNVDNNSDDNKNNQENSIKSRLRSSKIKDDGLQKFKKNNLNSPKNIINTNDESRINDILLIHEGNIKSSLYENYKLLSSQVILQSNNSIIPETEAEDYVLKGKYKKIAPKRSSLLKTHQTLENRIFPKRKKRSLIDFGIKSKFKTKNITITTPKVTPKPDQSTQSIIIEVPNQNSFETQENNIALPEVSGNVNAKDTVAQETPDDILKPPKNKSMSTPRRRSTHIRCLDFSTPQPKNSTRDKARSKLFCGTPKIENIVEENTVIESPLPKLQADWGSVNGFESIVRKENAIHWDSDIRDMVGAGILTSDADGDGRKKKKKKIPRKTIKTKDDKNNVSFEEQNKSNNSSEINELHTDETDKSKNQFILNNSNTNKLLIDDNKSLDILNNEFPISLETPNKATILCKEQLPIESNSKKSLSNSTLLNKQSQPFILLENSTEFIKEQLSTESNSYNNFNDLKFSNKHSIFSISLETPDKITELSKEQSPIKSNSMKNKKSKKQTKFSISFKTPDKMKELSPQIKSTSKKSLSKTQTKPEVSVTVINEHENKLNTSTVGNCSNSIIISDVTEKDKDKKKDSNFLESFNNINYLKHPDNKLNELTGNLIKSTLLDQNETHNSDHKNPLELVENQIINHNLIDTPYKSDDAVDVPETPISKIIREYDQSKLVTPLPCTPQHYEDSTETPLTKVFRETSYLNRPPISPFPPTPGNSRSVDTLIVPPEQENPRNFNITSCKVNNSNEVLAQPPIQINNNNESVIKTKKNKLTPFKTKTQNQKKKNIDAKVKLYETIKDELFGSEISSSSSVENTPTKKSKQLIINKKTQENEKKSGFKPIPKRKIIQSKVVNNAENHTLSECNSKLIKSTSIIATIPSTLQSKNISLKKTEKNSNIKSSSKSKKNMVHFDDPVEKCYNLSLNENLSKSVNNNREIENKIKINQEPKQSNEGNKYSSQSNIFDKCNSNENNIKKTEPEIKIIKLNNSDSNINYLKKYNEIKSDDKILNQLPECLNNKTKMNDSGNEQNKLSRICTTDEAKKSMILNKLNYASLTSPSVKTSNQSQTELTKVNYNNKNNISCINIGHTDESFQLSKYDDQFNNLEYLKKTIMYEVINEDGEHDMVYINLSESFNLLDIPSTLNNTASLNPVTSPLITKKLLDITPKMEFSQIKDNEDIPMTSTPKDYTEKKSNERQERLRRSPSFWEDSNTNYPIKYRDKHRESNSFRNKNHRDRYDNKQRTKKSFRHHDERLQTDNRNRLQRNHRNSYDERDFRDDSINYKNRYKHKEDKRSFGIYHGYNYDERNSHAHYVHDRLDDSDRFSNLQKISQNDSHKLNRIEDIKKATKRPADRTDFNKTSAKVSKVEHQRLLKNIDVDDFLSVVHGRKSK